MGKTAIILGSTGLTGGFLLNLLLADSRYSEIRLFNRNPISKEHPKIKEFIVDLLTSESYASEFRGHEVFCCIGTTAAKTKDKQRYKSIDYGIPVSAAHLSKVNEILTFVVISSMGANSASSIFYNRIKGEMERDVMNQNVSKTFILQPSLIGGHRKERRIGEYLGKLFMRALDPLLVGSLKKYRIIHPETIAKAMISLVNSNQPSGVYTSDELKNWANQWH